jgi:RNA polymerase sigma factor (sigma-70 family)
VHVSTDARQERFRVIYESAHARLLAYALRRTTNAQDAADVVAETFTVAWRRLDDLPDGDEAILWLYATARRVLANLHRKARRRRELIDHIAAGLAGVVSQGVDPGDADSMSALLALGQLEEREREVLMLTGWEGLTSAQLASVLGCSPTAARIRLHRARRHLLASMHAAGLSVKQSTASRHAALVVDQRGNASKEA